MKLNEIKSVSTKTVLALLPALIVGGLVLVVIWLITRSISDAVTGGGVAGFVTSLFGGAGKRVATGVGSDPGDAARRDLDLLRESSTALGDGLDEQHRALTGARQDIGNRIDESNRVAGSIADSIRNQRADRAKRD